MTTEKNKNTTPLSQFKGNLHDIEMYLDVIFNNIEDPIFVKDEECRLLLVNDAFCSIFGLTRKDIIGKTLAEKVTPREREHFLSTDRLVLAEGNESKCEGTITTNGVQTKTILTRKNRFVDSKGNYFLIGVMRDITENKLSKEVLQESQNHFGQIFDGSLTEIFIFDAETYHFIKVNRGARENMGYSNEEFTKLSPVEIKPQMSLENFNLLVESLRSGKKNIIQFETVHQRKNGTHYNVEIHLQLTEYMGRSAFVAITLDISQRKKSEEKLKLAASVFTNAREGIVITDVTGSIIDLNETFSRITGFSREELIGQNPRILKSGRQTLAFYKDMWQTLIKNDYWSGEVWNRRKNGELYAEIKTINAVRDEHGTTTHYVALSSDISLRKERENQLERIAHYDTLTNLPNRVLLADRLSQAMLQCNRHQKSLAVVFLDLDEFKEVNDTHGHDVGDELLIALSLRMKKALRKGDTLARFGGDEYVAVLADLAKVEDCVPILERFLQAASDPVTVDNLVLNVSASIGVTFYPQDSVDADQLIRHADQAMYVAKESGKNRYHFFDTAQDDAVKVQRKCLKAIRSALDEQQFVLYYQPKVNMRTGTVIGVEALIRWQHPERGLLNPLEFLPAIENHTMSIEMGEWVINTALTQISQWQKMGLNLPVRTSVNISAVQLQQPEFTERLTNLLAAHPDVDPRYLELEVLETSALDDVQNVSGIMKTCMALGVNFALDDFGTGYSSLTYLRQLPASLIKIDSSFVRDMLSNPDDLAIVEGVIALAKSFKRDVIAEGVETIEHGIVLLRLGCDLAQGYGIAMPMPACDIPAWISDWKPDTSWRT